MWSLISPRGGLQQGIYLSAVALRFEDVTFEISDVLWDFILLVYIFFTLLEILYFSVLCIHLTAAVITLQIVLFDSIQNAK